MDIVCILFYPRRMLGSIDPLVDAFNYSAASLDKSSIASMVRKHQRAEETGAFSVGSPTTATPQNKIQELLSSSMRPVWMDTKLDADGNPAKVEGMVCGLLKKIRGDAVFNVSGKEHEFVFPLSLLVLIYLSFKDIIFSFFSHCSAREESQRGW